MLNVGDPVPDFTLPLATADGKRDPVQLKQLLDGKPLLIGFFPLAFTSTCTKEMCEMRDQQAYLDHVGANAVGFSIDTAPCNVQFAKAHNLKHGIYSDPNREVVGKIWETMTVAGVHHVAKRGWLVVSPEGKVAAKWVAPEPGVWSGFEPIAKALHQFPHGH